MSNPNIVYLANDSPRPSTPTTTAKQTATITSNILSNQVETFSSEIQITETPAFSNEPGNLIPGCQSNVSSSINPPLPNITGYYDLAPNVDVLPLDYASNYLAGGYCDFDCSNVWGYMPNEEVSLTPAIPQIKEMALNPYSAPDNPTHSTTHPVVLDSSETSKQYNQEVDKFLNKIKLNENDANKTKIKKKFACDCTKYKKNKTSDKHVSMKKTKPAQDASKVSSVKTNVVSKNRKNIEKIKKQIDFIENEIQRRKTELSVKEQQIQNEINIIQQKQPIIIENSAHGLVTSSDNERDILDDQPFETEPTSNELKKKGQIKSVVNITRNFNMKNSNKIDKVRSKSRSTKYNNHPYMSPLKVKSFAKDNIFKSNSANDNTTSNNTFKKSQIKTDRCGKKMKENIVISLNLEQELNSSSKQFTISQHESKDRNEKEIHFTIKITENDKPPQINSTNKEEDYGSVKDLSFLDEIDVDEIVECLNVSDELMETDVTASECHLQNLKGEDDNINTTMPGAPKDIKIYSTETWHKPEKQHTNLSSLNSQLKIEKVLQAAQAADSTQTKIIKSDENYDEFMEICNVVNDPGFLESSEKPSLTIEQSSAENQYPLAIADSYDPVIIKSCTIAKDTISEYSNEEIVIQDNSEPHHANHVNEDFKDNSSESAVSLTSYSTCNEFECSNNNNNTLAPDILQEDLKSDDIERRAKNLLLSIFNNPELQYTKAKSISNMSSYTISNEENVSDYYDSMAVCSSDSDVDNSNENLDYDRSETLIFECNNNNEDIFKENNNNNTKNNVDNLQVCHKIQTQNSPETILSRNIQNIDDVLTTPYHNNNITEAQIVEKSINTNRCIKTNKTMEDQNKHNSEKIKENDHKSSNADFDIQKKTRISDQIESETCASNYPITNIKIECDDMEVDSEEQERKKNEKIYWTVNSSSISTKEHTQFVNNIESKIEISEKQRNNYENNTNSADVKDKNVEIITPKLNTEIIDLTAGTETKNKHKKITFSEVSDSVKEKSISENININANENDNLPPIEPLKLPRDFAIALKLEQGISLFFNSEFEITGIIKRGMYSDIYRARNKNTGHVTAAKVIRNRKELKRIGIQKAEWMKELQGGIPKDKYHCLYLLQGLIVDGMWCSILEYYPKNLEQVLMDRGRGFPIDDVQKLARQLVAAVLLLRNHKIIHSDIKPNHILLDATNKHLKLGGFDESFQKIHFKNISYIGTVHYRAPELILGYYVGHGIDVWSTALVLYEMMTNIKLFPANTNNEVLYQQLCTVGPVPTRMLNSSKYKEFHYRGDHFFRDGMDPAYKRQPRIIKLFFESERINTTVYGAYTKHWARTRREHKDADYAILNQFCELIKQMLFMDPPYRLGIESVYAHGFIYDLYEATTPCSTFYLDVTLTTNQKLAE